MLHVAVPTIDCARLHVPVKLPEPDGVTEKFRVPNGVIGLPLDVSFTVAVHTVDWPTATVAGRQLMIVLVVLVVTFTAMVLDPLAEWVESPV